MGTIIFAVRGYVSENRDDVEFASLMSDVCNLRQLLVTQGLSKGACDCQGIVESEAVRIAAEGSLSNDLYRIYDEIGSEEIEPLGQSVPPLTRICDLREGGDDFQERFLQSFFIHKHRPGLPIGTRSMIVSILF